MIYGLEGAVDKTRARSLPVWPFAAQFVPGNDELNSLLPPIGKRFAPLLIYRMYLGHFRSKRILFRRGVAGARASRFFAVRAGLA